MFFKEINIKYHTVFLMNTFMSSFHEDVELSLLSKIGIT